jgi:hypothetical protein
VSGWKGEVIHRDMELSGEGRGGLGRGARAGPAFIHEGRSYLPDALKSRQIRGMTPASRCAMLAEAVRVTALTLSSSAALSFADLRGVLVLRLMPRRLRRPPPVSCRLVYVQADILPWQSTPTPTVKLICHCPTYRPNRRE